MERALVIGSDVRCKYGEEDTIKTFYEFYPYPTESVVYRAELLEPGSSSKKNLVAVKKFRIGSSTREATQIKDSDLLMRWQNLTKLKHGNIVSYHKTAIQWMHPESDSGLTYIELDFVMDYCDGCDLQTMMSDMLKAKRNLYVKTLLDFSKQIANGLAYLHKNNIIHGDLKPNSVLVDKSSMNHFRLRLCGLDNFSSSYAAFVRRRCHAKCLAPEVLTIIRDGASLVLDDPVFSAFHGIQKQLKTRKGASHWAMAVGAEFEEILIDAYGSYGVLQEKSGEDKVRLLECFSYYLQRLIARYEGWRPYNLNLLLLRQMQDVCSVSSTGARQLCALLENDMDPDAHFKAPVVTLDNVLAVFFQQIRGHTTPSPEASTLTGLEPRILCKLNESVRFDGRKADIWSIGRILIDLAHLTFDTKITNVAREAPFGLRTLNNFFMENFHGADFNFYMTSFVPQDFNHIVISCQHRPADERPTSEELANKLVELEEHTYGGTWVNNPQDGVTKQQSDSHRQMLEEIGSTCTYDYCFWRDFLGQGAYGHVYEATIINPGTYKGNGTVAVKQVGLTNIRIKQMKQDGSWDKARDQWQKLVELRHPHLVTYHKVTLWKLIHGASIEFMMDCCQGGDLDALISQCKTGISSLSSEGVANYATQLALGLCFLHKNQFIHGDMKPGNVLMNRATGDTGNRTLRIGDLDTAVRIRENCARSERRDLAGTGPYMSPEMVKQFYQQDHEDIGFPTDIWGLGCVVLDLANCSVGIKERLFYKTVMNSEGISKTKKIERHCFSADAFLFQMSKGYHPVVSGLICQDIRDVIQRCLLPAGKDRATAAQILEQLLILNRTNAVPTLQCAKKNDILKLFDICVEYATKTVDKNNCLTMLEAAKVLDAEQLVTKCFEIVDTHGSELLESERFLQLKKETLREIFNRDTLIVNEQELCKAAKRWAANACRSSGREPTGANCRIILGEVIFAVRFPKMDVEQQANSPLSTGLLLDEEFHKIHQFKLAGKKPNIPFLGPPRSSEITFCGWQWKILDSSTRDTNHTMKATAGSVFVDKHGHLHLRVSQHSGVWKGAGLRLVGALVFGRCKFHIEGLDRLDPDDVFEVRSLAQNGLSFGIFCSKLLHGKFQMRYDVDFSAGRSSNSIAPSSADTDFDIEGETLTTHCFHRRPHSVSFSCQRGHQHDNTAGELCNWSYDCGPSVHLTALPLFIVLLPGPVVTAPADRKETEIIVHSFDFYPHVEAT